MSGMLFSMLPARIGGPCPTWCGCWIRERKVRKMQLINTTKPYKMAMNSYANSERWVLLETVSYTHLVLILSLISDLLECVSFYFFLNCWLTVIFGHFLYLSLGNTWRLLDKCSTQYRSQFSTKRDFYVIFACSVIWHRCTQTIYSYDLTGCTCMLVILWIHLRWTCCYPKWDLFNANNDLILTIGGPLCQCKCCGDVVYNVCTLSLFPWYSYLDNIFPQDR